MPLSGWRRSPQAGTNVWDHALATCRERFGIKEQFILNYPAIVDPLGSPAYPAQEIIGRASPAQYVQDLLPR